MKICPTIAKKCPTNTFLLETLQQTLNDEIVIIPFYENVRASAGSGAYNDEESSQPFSFSKSFLREYFGLLSFANLSVIIGYGNSMSPTLLENCYLLVQQREAKEGEICVTRIKRGAICKTPPKTP